MGFFVSFHHRTKLCVTFFYFSMCIVAVKQVSSCLASKGVTIEHTVGGQNQDFFEMHSDSHSSRNMNHNHSKNCTKKNKTKNKKKKKKTLLSIKP